MPKRIAYVVDYFPSVSETFVQNEIAYLASLGWQVRVFALKAQASEHRHAAVNWLVDLTDYCSNRLVLSKEMLRAHLAAFARAPYRYLSTLGFTVANSLTSVGDLTRGIYCFVKAVYFAEMARGYSIQHIHAHFAYNRAAVAMLMARLAGITFSFTGHSHEVVLGVPMFAAKVRNARFIVVSSDFIRRKLEGWFPNLDPRKVHVIRTGIDLKCFQPPSSQSNHVASRILTVARLIECKGIHVLIDACEMLRERGKEFQCTIVGDGQLRGELERRIEAYGLQSRVRILGHVGDDELALLLQQATVFALPCLMDSTGVHDGLPVALIEAMAMGLPTVSTRLSAIPELIEDGVCGVLVEEKDVVALADALERIMEDAELRRHLATAARSKVEREYEIGDNVSRLAALFEQA